VFLEGQIFLVEVEDSHVDAEGQRKDDSLIYSRVTKIVSAQLQDWGNQEITQSTQSPQSTDSRNQESKIMQSRNQESTNQGGRVGSGASPQPGVGNAHAKQTRRAGASVPAQAEGEKLTV
jgi:hypothetical protein